MNNRYRHCAEPVARSLLGKPNERLSTPQELRFGSNGSLSVVLAGTKAGLWYDHEHSIGGGLIDLVMRFQNMSRGEALAWLTAEMGAER